MCGVLASVDFGVCRIVSVSVKYIRFLTHYLLAKPLSQFMFWMKTWLYIRLCKYLCCLVLSQCVGVGRGEGSMQWIGNKGAVGCSMAYVSLVHRPFVLIVWEKEK